MTMSSVRAGTLVTWTVIGHKLFALVMYKADVGVKATETTLDRLQASCMELKTYRSSWTSQLRQRYIMMSADRCIFVCATNHLLPLISCYSKRKQGRLTTICTVCS